MILYTESTPNKFKCEESNVIKTGFVFNTGSKDIFLNAGDNIVKLGNHELYEMHFADPLKYIGFVYFQNERIERSIILLFQDWKDREISRNEKIGFYTSFIYNSRKSIYSLIRINGQDDIKNIYMNDIQFFQESKPMFNRFQNSKPEQLQLFA